MKFALVDDIKTEATKGATGTCPGCGAELIAKCGEVKINHWAHKIIRNCDRWWEPETEWHRAWKNKFPVDWQEICLPDKQTGERHIADVRTVHELVVEFQHSRLDPLERTAREQFYPNLVWVVNGTRLKRDFPRFLKGMKHYQFLKKDIFRVDDPEQFLPLAWLQSTVPVVFDFKGIDLGVDLHDWKKNLFCLFPVRVGKSATVAEIPHQTFINAVINGNWTPHVSGYINKLSQENKEWQHRDAQFRQNLVLQDMKRQHFMTIVNYGKRRRL